MWLPCCAHATLFRCAVMPWSYVNVDMRRFGAVCCRWHVAVLAVLFACSFMSLFCLDLKLICTCVVLAPSTVDSSSPFLLIDLSFCLCIYMSASVFLSIYLSSYLSINLSIYLFVYLSFCLSVCLSFYLPTYLSICLSVCLSLCQPVAAAWCHSSMSSLPVVVYLGVYLTFLLVAWLCRCLVVCMQLCSAVLWCVDLMLMSTCGVLAPSAVDGMSLSLPCCLRAALCRCFALISS